MSGMGGAPRCAVLRVGTGGCSRFSSLSSSFEGASPVLGEPPARPAPVLCCGPVPCSTAGVEIQYPLSLGSAGGCEHLSMPTPPRRPPPVLSPSPAAAGTLCPTPVPRPFPSPGQLPGSGWPRHHLEGDIEGVPLCPLPAKKNCSGCVCECVREGVSCPRHLPAFLNIDLLRRFSNAVIKTTFRECA